MIEIKKITKSFGSKVVLKEVDLKCKTGAIQALLGANGAGKSTLINIISGLLKYDSGSYYINKERISFKNYQYKKNIGYVFENPLYIEKLSAQEYLFFVSKMYKIPKHECKKRIFELLDYFELPVNNKKYIEKYSTGMKKKLSIAAAIIHNPKYLILDEPFEGLDFISTQKIITLFKDMASTNTTILITSHQFDIISDLCDYFSLLKNGRIIFNMTMDQLYKVSLKDKSNNNKLFNSKSVVKDYLTELMDSSKKTNLSWI